jgi:UDP-N-acetylmuramate--alanine ligase
VDDYAHHPSELQSVLQAINDSWPAQRKLVIFQPHRYSRTRDLLEDFSQVLSDVENLVIMEIYPAGESPLAGADGRALCRAIRARGKVIPVFVESRDELRELLANTLQGDDVVVTLGAGDIGKIAQELPAWVSDISEVVT